MIYLLLFLEFLKIGLFAFGGAYGAIPIIQEVVLKNGWMDEEMFANMIAISESTPGPIMVNTATYIGNMQAGILGAIVATLGVILPSFIIVLFIIILFQKLIKNRHMQMVLKGIQPCIMGIVIATGLFILESVIITPSHIQKIDYFSLLIFIVLISVSSIFFFKKKKMISPIVLIIVSAILGCILL